MPSVEARLSELVLRWDKLRRRGQPIPVEDLCSDCPELLQDLRRRIHDLEEMDAVLSSGTDPAEEGRPEPEVSIASGSPFAGYEVLGEIGHGGMGVVYRALDRRRGEIVALKTVQHLGPSALERFKREFRALADVAHPNLVTLYELVSDGRGWFFTMELVGGVDFLSHVRSASDSFLSERFRDAFRQFAGGVAALHHAGKLHRDLKPSNVRVTPAGRVVVLDFGLVAELEPTGQHQSTEPHILGTVAYMAPEQAAGLPVGPAADWYSVGVMLYEALTGSLPFQGGPVEVLAAKQAHESPRPSELVPGISDDLDLLCADLLHRDPVTRPAGPEVLRRLGSMPDEPGPHIVLQPAPRQATPLVGRQRHLEILREAFAAVQQGPAVTLFLHGPSGAGKTVLAQRFLDGLIESDVAVVLMGRCYEQESVPYKALDGLIDELSRYLRHIPAHEARELMPRDVLSLARVFPVLRRVEAVAAAPGRTFEIPDPQELRRRAFAALRELLARLGDRRPLVLFIDDLQWGDADSAALLAEVLRPPDPPVLLLLGAYRTEDVATSVFLRKVLSSQGEANPSLDRRELAIEALTTSQAQSLVLELIGPEDPLARVWAGAIARESQGNPFFVHELVRHVQSCAEPVAQSNSAGEIALEEVLWVRTASLPEGARRLLEVIAVSGRPLGRTEACRAAGLETDGRAALAVLRAGRLARVTGQAEQDIIETYHDRIRETVVARLGQHALQSLHHRLAHVLEASGRSDPEILATHFQRAGVPERAGRFYALAAAQAVETLAFDHAATLYRLALESRSTKDAEGHELQTKLADALANAGRGADAAQEYLAATQMATLPEALELKRRAAMQFLISGHIDRGLAVLRDVLLEVGMKMPAAPWRALLSLLFRQAQVRLRGLSFRLRHIDEIPARDLIRIDICWAAVAGLSIVDIIMGAHFQVMNLLHSLSAGEPNRIVRALAMEAIHSSAKGWPNRHRTHELLHAAEDLSRRIVHPSAASAVTVEKGVATYASGMVTLAKGIAAYLEGRWKTGLEFLDQADEIFRDHCTGAAWEIDTARSFSLWSLTRMGEFGELSGRWSTLIREELSRGDLYINTNMKTYMMTMLKLSDDNPDRAVEELHRIMTQWSRQGWHVQHNEGKAAEIEIDLYRGDGVTAWRRVTRYWPTLEGSLLLRAQIIRNVMTHLRARCALAAARSIASRGPLLRVAERVARRLQREHTPYADAMAYLIHAGVASSRGHLDDTITWLDGASARFDTVDMPIYAATARRRLGEILGGENGRALVKKADAWMSSQGIKNPARMTAMYVTGFPE